MRKVFLSLLVIACALMAVPAWAQVFTPKDTIIEEGYYRWVFKQRTPNSKGQVGDSLIVATEYEKVGGTAGLYGLGCISRAQFSENDLEQYWHITRAGDKNGSPTWHLRNCRSDGYNWWYPVTPTIGQSDQILAVTRELDSVHIRLCDFGATESTSAGKTGSCTNTTTKAYPTQLVEGETGMFFVPTCNVWRMRIGNNANVLLKLNSQSGVEGATLYLEKVDFGDKLAWIILNEATSEARGMLVDYGTEASETMNKVSSQAALDAFIQVVDQATELIEEGGTNDEYAAMTDKVKAAIKEVKKYENALEDDMYVAVYDWYRPSYPDGFNKWFAPFYDLQAREKLSSSGTLPKRISDPEGLSVIDSVGRQCNWSAWAGGWLLGYQCGYDVDATTVPQEFIWHLKKVGDAEGVYTMKNCAESSYSGDSTYFCPLWFGPESGPGKLGGAVRRTSTGYYVDNTYQRHSYMAGTAKTNVWLRHRQANFYWIYPTQNPNNYNQGVNNLCTTNPLNATTYATWVINKVPDSRITAKFKLNEAITDAAGIFIDWPCSDNPGQLKRSVGEPLQKAVAAAREVYAKAGASDAEYTAATTALLEVYNATLEQLKDTDNVLNPIEDGAYYRIIGAQRDMFGWYHGDKRWNDNWTYEGYDSVHVNPNMYADEENILKWQVYSDRTDPNELWKFTKLEGGKWAIQNLGTGRYIDGAATTNTKIPLVQEPSPQTVTQDIGYTSDVLNPHMYDRWKTNGRWAIYGPYHEQYPHYYNQHSNGAGNGSYCTEWKTEWSAAHYLEKETDMALLDSLIAVGTQKALNTEALSALTRADQVKSRTVAYTFNAADSLLYEAGAVYGLKDVNGEDSIGYDITKNQFNCNNKHWTEGNYYGLIDGNPATYLHTRYSTAGGPTPTKYSWLQVDLRDKPQQNFCFKLNLRGESNALYGNYGGRRITYGRTDYGDIYRPLEIVIYGANDTIEGTEWKEVKHIANMPTHEEFRTYWSPLVEADQPYRYYRFEVPSTKGNNLFGGIPYWAWGEFQVYPATYDAAKSTSVYDAATKSAVEALDAAVATLKAEAATEKVTQAALDAVYAAAQGVEDVTIDSMQLVCRILEAQVLADSSYIENDVNKQQYGDVTSDQKAALTAAIAAAKTAAAAATPTQADYDAAYNALDEAFWTLNGQRKTFEVGKWYYMVSPETYSYHGAPGQYSWRGGHLIYACGNGAQPWAEDGKVGNTVDPIRWGHYNNFRAVTDGLTDGAYPKNVNLSPADWDLYTGGQIDCPNYPYAMWRIVKIEGEDSLYAIQNRATGLYVGRRRDYRNEVPNKSNGITQSLEPLKLQLNLVGRNQYEAIPVDSAQIAYFSSTENAMNGVKNYSDYGAPLHQQGADFLMVWWGSGTERGFNTGSAIEFRPVPDDNLLTEAEYPAEDNSMRIVAFPFDVNLDDVWTTSATSDVVFYGLKSVSVDNADSTSTVDLTELEGGVIEAGTPFIMQIGEPESYIEGAVDSISLMIPMENVETYSLTSKTNNGLVSVLYGDSIGPKPGFGFFASSVLKVTDSTKVWIEGQNGYIDPNQVVDPNPAADGDAQLKIDGLLDGIKVIRTSRNNNEAVDVYSVDGKMIKRQAKKGEATKGLSKGIYIVGKTKVYVQ